VVKKKTDSAKPRQGWGWPINSRKAHYFVDGLSLCRKMMYLGSQLEEGNDESEDNCAGCKERLRRHKAPQV
jgi:hypothetical protein